MAHMDAASRLGGARSSSRRYVCPRGPATHVSVSARRPVPVRGGGDAMAWHGMAWHGAGDSIIPSAIPDSHRAAAAAAAAAIAPGGFPFRSR